MQPTNTCSIASIVLFIGLSFLGADLHAQTSSSKAKSESILKSIELRDYILQPGMFQPFSDFMNEIIIPKQISLGGHVLNIFNLKDSADNFVWIRGFKDMEARSKFMKAFYYSDYWKQHAAKTNSMLIDSYNVNLLKPVIIKGQAIDTTSGISTSAFKNQNGIAVISYYLTNNKRNELIEFFASDYLPILNKVGINDPILLVCETAPNDYLPQHVYVDSNLLVTISWFTDERDYKAKMVLIEAHLSEASKNKLKGVVASMSLQILQPAGR